MTETITESPYPMSPACAAQLDTVDGDAAMVRVGRDWTAPASRARMALPPGVAAAPGDEVVVIGLGSPEAFVVGVLGASTTPALRTTDGTSAELTADGRGVVVKRADGHMLFEYDVEAGGRVTLRGDAIRLKSEVGGIELESATDVKIAGRTVHISGEEADLDTARIRVRARTLDANVDRARVALRRSELVADVIVETARNVYRKVQGLSQLRAGRVKTIADGTAWLKARQVIHRTDHAYKVKSDDIQLG